jgi:hypothetical protein
MLIKRIFAQASAMASAVVAQLGVHEVLFLAGLGGFFYGLSELWSLAGAFTVCGAILMLVAIVSIMFAQRKGD